MHDDLDLRVIERHHDADPRYRAELRRRVAAILDGTEALPADDALVEAITIDLAAQRPTRLEHRRRWVLGVAALVGAAAAIAGIVVVTAGRETLAPTVDSVPVPLSTVPAPPPTTTETPTSGGMWPQSTLEEVRVAQERADAGDPDYTWQVAATDAVRARGLGRAHRNSSSSTGSSVRCWAGRHICSTDMQAGAPLRRRRGSARWHSARPSLSPVCAGTHEPALPTPAWLGTARRAVRADDRRLQLRVGEPRSRPARASRP